LKEKSALKSLTKLTTKLTKSKEIYTLEMAPLSFQSCRPYKLVNILSSSLSGPNLVFFCFGGAAAGAAAPD
jgi:hypothetical protein